MPLAAEHISQAPWMARHEEHDLCARVKAEFREMPGLRLTLPQAARLFNLERGRCERVLNALVHAGWLATDGNAFANPLEGRRSA